MIHLSYETVVKRWPVILTGVIDTIYRVDHRISVALSSEGINTTELAHCEQKISEGKIIIEKISKLKYDMARDRTLEYASAIRAKILQRSDLQK